MQLYEKYAERGLVVMMVSAEADSKVESYPSDNKIPFIVATTPDATLKAYNVTGFPSTYLIDGHGRVVWEGHPGHVTDGDIDKLMKSVTWTALPELPKALASAKASFEAGKFGDAAKKAEAKMKTEQEGAETILLKIAEAAAKRFSAVDVAVEAGQYPDAFAILDRMQAEFKGLEASKRAKEREAELKKDKGIAEEMKAFTVLAKYQAALDRARSNAEKKRLIPVLEAFMKKFPGYYASRDAEQKIEILRALK